MAQKKYRLTNNDTGESYVIMSDHAPTDDETDRIFALKKQDKAAGEQAKNASKLVTLPSAWKATKDVAKSFASPEGLATMGMAIIAPESIPALTGLNLGRTIKQGYDTYKDPSLENVSATVGSALSTGVLGAASSYTPKAAPRLLNEGSQGLIDGTTGGIPATESPLGNVRQITVDSEVPTVNPPKQIPARTEAGNPVRGQGFTLNAPKVIRPTTEGVYEIPAPMTSRSASTKLKYGGGEGSRLQNEPTGFQTVPKVNAPASAGQEVTTPTKPAEIPDTPATTEAPTKTVAKKTKARVAVKKAKTAPKAEEAPVDDTSTTSNTNDPLDIFSSTDKYQEASKQSQDYWDKLGTQDRYKLLNKFNNEGNRANVSPHKAWSEMDEGAKNKLIGYMNKNNLIGGTKETVSNKPVEIENKWLRQSDEQLLHTMRPGATGQLAKEIDAVLAERGLKYEEKPSEPIRPILNKEAFDQYSQVLNDLASHGKAIGHIVLRDAAELGKKSGLDQEIVANDLIENLHPEVTNSSNKAWNATKKVFDPLGSED